MGFQVLVSHAFIELVHILWIHGRDRSDYHVLDFALSAHSLSLFQKPDPSGCLAISRQDIPHVFIKIPGLRIVKELREQSDKTSNKPAFMLKANVDSEGIPDPQEECPIEILFIKPNAIVIDVLLKECL